MNNDSESLSLIIIAFIAGFIILQLRRTLGRRDGYDGKDEKDKKNPFKDNNKGAEKPNDNIVPIRAPVNPPQNNGDTFDDTQHDDEKDVGVAAESPFYKSLEKIKSFDHSFNLAEFIDGAEYAYGMILNAFWDGDAKTLKTFLSRDVFKQFDDAIQNMKEQGRHFDNTLNDVEKIELVEASINGSMAELTLRYNSHMTIVVKEEDDNVVEGDQEKVVPVVDVWTFSRDVKRNDPNWILVSTSNT